MNVSLSAPGPLDVASTLSRYRRWGEDPVNRLEDGRFRRALQVDGRWHGYDLSWTDDADRAQLTIAVPGHAVAAWWMPPSPKHGTSSASIWT